MSIPQFPPNWKIFPLRSRTKEGHLVPSWPADATNNPAQIEKWTRQFPGCNWATATGQASGTLMVDADNAEGIKWMDENLPPTLAVQTGKFAPDQFGRHAYYSTPPGIRIRNTVKEIAPGIDTRGDGGYAVLPPSIHPDKHAYQWLYAPIALAPEWLLELLRAPGEAAGSPSQQGELKPPTQAQIRSAADMLKKGCDELAAMQPETGRNIALNKLAFTAAGLIASGCLVANASWNAIYESALECGLDERAVRATMKSAKEGVQEPFMPEEPWEAPLKHVVYLKSIFSTKWVPKVQVENVPFAGTSEATQQQWSQPTRKVEIVSANSITPEKIDWNWKNWLPIGKLALIAGDGKVGKSQLTLSIAATITNGGEWPDGTKCEKPGNVYIWTSEDGIADTVVPRLMANGAKLEKVKFIKATRDEKGNERNFEPSTDIPLLLEAMKDDNEVALVIVDPVIRSVDGDMNQANIVRKNVELLGQLAEARRCTIIGITHFTKNSAGTDPMYRVIGSQAFTAVARTVLVSAKDKNSEKRVVAVAAGNVGKGDVGGYEYLIEEALVANDIETSRIRWCDKVGGSAWFLLDKFEMPEKFEKKNESGVSYEKLESQEIAQQILSDALKGGPRPATEMEELIQKEGLKKSDVLWAKKRLGIKSKKSGLQGGWEWHLNAEIDWSRLNTAS